MSLALVAQRFPALARWLADAPAAGRVELLGGAHTTLRIEGVQLASRHDPRAEAELQARLVPAGARRATVYGFAQGELVRVLLARAELEALRVVVLNPGVAHESLARSQPAEWLADARVELLRPGELVELERPFAASPADLRLACDEAARLANLVQLELATPFLARRQRERADELLARIAENEERYGADPEVSRLFGTRAGATLCVAAAGPTLARSYAELRRRAADLIAVDGALKPLLEAGIVPAFVVTQDAHEEGLRRLFAVTAPGLARCTLVYFPEVPGHVLAGWPGPRVAARGPGELHRRAPSRRPVGTLFSSGSVVHPAIDLAVRLGAQRVELFGTDFAMPGGQSHVTGSAWQFRWELGPAAAWVLDGDGRRVPSLPNLIGYLCDLERYIAAHPEVEFVSRSRAGAAIRGARIHDLHELDDHHAEASAAPRATPGGGVHVPGA